MSDTRDAHVRAALSAAGRMCTSMDRLAAALVPAKRRGFCPDAEVAGNAFADLLRARVDYDRAVEALETLAWNKER